MINAVQYRSAAEWEMARARFCRLCASVISNPTPIVENRRIGGLDLGTMAHYCYRERVWEEPKKAPDWVHIFGWLPAVSIETATSSSGSSIYRCTLVMTIAGLERRIGKLVQRDDASWSFETGNVQIYLSGFNEASLKEAQEAGEVAKAWRWTVPSTRVVIPGKRFGGQRPSQLTVARSDLREAVWHTICMVSSLIGINQRSSNGTLVKETTSLGKLIHGSDIEGDQLGLMIECI
jgi:hypothetical protein